MTGPAGTMNLMRGRRAAGGSPGVRVLPGAR